MSSAPDARTWSPGTALAMRCYSAGCTEANFYRAVHYLAGALWCMDAADEALTALNDVLGRVTNDQRQAL